MDTQSIKAALVLAFTLSSCQNLPPVQAHSWKHSLAAKSAQLQPQLLHAERQLAEQLRSEKLGNRLAEAASVGVAATSDGGAAPTLSINVLKLLRSDQSSREAQAQLHKLRRQHDIAVSRAARESEAAQRYNRWLRPKGRALRAAERSQAALYEQGDITEAELLAARAELRAHDFEIEKAELAAARKLDELESLTLLERDKLK